jgi:hypothetical protein
MATFWNSVNMDPKRQFRFVLRFPLTGQGLKVPEYVIKTVTKPKVTISSVPHTFMDHEFKYPGRVTWDPVTITLVDPGSKEEDMAQALMNKLGKSGYQYPNTFPQSLESMSKQKANSAVGRVTIAQLNAAGEDTEVWTLVNPFLTSIDLGGLDYSADELSEITIELTYDWAVLNGSQATGPALLKKTNFLPEGTS